MFKQILKISFAISLGIIPAIWVIQNDKRVKQYITQNLIKSLEKTWNAKIEIKEFDLNFFTSSIYLKNGKFSFLCDSKCTWKFDYGKIKLSNIISLIKKEIFLELCFDNFTINTFNKIQKAHCKTIKHMKDIFESTSNYAIDISLKSILINNLNLIINEPNKNTFNLNLPGRFYGRQLKLFNKDKWIISANTNNGNLNINNQALIHKINCFFSLSEQTDSKFKATFKSNFKLQQDKNATFFAQGNFQKNKLNIQIEGKESLFINQANFNISFDEKKLKTNIDIQLHKGIKIGGKSETNFDIFKSGIFLKNTKRISLDEDKKYFIPKNGIQIKANIDKQFNVNAKYFIKLFNKTEKKNFSTTGKFNLNKSSLCINGDSSFASYTIKANLFPNFYFTTLNLFNNDNYLIKLENKYKNKKLTGNIKTIFLRPFLPQESRKIFLTDKKHFKMILYQDSFNPVKGQLFFDDGPLYLPGSFNLIKNFTSNFLMNLDSKKIIFQNTEIKFYKGTIHSPQITIQLDNNGEINSIHSPLEINDLFINFDKSFYAIFYGNILAEKKSNNHLKITGDIIAKKAFLKDNPFAKNSQYNLQDINTNRQPDMDFEVNVNLSNQNPVKINTNFLNATSNFDLNIKTSKIKDQNSFSKILGTIEIENGELDFLRNKLQIHHGKIQFLPNHINDPTINISAKNKIKKYFINMQISGTLQNPQISLESTPTLTEEQILALLMAGSENASFQTDLPAILMQNLNDWVLERKNIQPKTKNFFEKITLPFKYIQITPNFTDQTGRGGVRGTVSIDVNKQLHAQIQKNFNLQEDFAFQVEYLLSDDINIKAIKDQRGELGSEMEVKFKF